MFGVAKIVQGESKEKQKPQDFDFSLPSRSLSYLKIVQGESKEKQKPQDFDFSLPSRRLSSRSRVVQGESKEKKSRAR